MLKLVVGRFKEKVMFHLNRNSSGILSYIHSQKKRNCQGYRDVVQKRKKMARVFFIIPFRSAHKYTTFHLWPTSLSFLDAYKNDPKTKTEARMNWISGSIFFPAKLLARSGFNNYESRY